MGMATIEKFIRYFFGIALILGGIAGLFLPFLQGIAMIVAGLILLGNHAIAKKTRSFVRYLKHRKDHHKNGQI